MIIRLIPQFSFSPMNFKTKFLICFLAMREADELLLYYLDFELLTSPFSHRVDNIPQEQIAYYPINIHIQFIIPGI